MRLSGVVQVVPTCANCGSTRRLAGAARVDGRRLAGLGRLHVWFAHPWAAPAWLGNKKVWLADPGRGAR